MSTTKQPTLLDGYKVLDLADEKGLLCGRILGDLGAEVVVVEPPGGHPARSIGPFYHGEADPEKSLFWFSYCMNKKSITLNIEKKDGKELLRRLASKVDVFIGCFPPGYLDTEGLGYQELSNLNPKLIMVSITPFGESGPYAEYKSADLVHWALGGMIWLSGEPGRAPVRISFPQSYLHAGAQAAVGTLVALAYREATGRGQEVKVSVHGCIPVITMDALAYWDIFKIDIPRMGAVRRRVMPGGVLEVRQVFRCKDGYVVNYIFGGALGEAANREWSEWMESEGVNIDHLKKIGWPALDFNKITPDQVKMVNETLAEFIARYTKKELYEGVFRRGGNIMLAPVSTPRDLKEDIQLRERNFWLKIEHPELKEDIEYPGPWAVVHEGPSLSGWRRAPLIGEHNKEIYQSMLGLSEGELATLKQGGII